jgi:hypothetical protein
MDQKTESINSSILQLITNARLDMSFGVLLDLIALYQRVVLKGDRGEIPAEKVHEDRTKNKLTVSLNCLGKLIKSLISEAHVKKIDLPTVFTKINQMYNEFAARERCPALKMADTLVSRLCSVLGTGVWSYYNQCRFPSAMNQETGLESQIRWILSHENNGGNTAEKSLGDFIEAETHQAYIITVVNRVMECTSVPQCDSVLQAEENFINGHPELSKIT